MFSLVEFSPIRVFAVALCLVSSACAVEQANPDQMLSAEVGPAMEDDAANTDAPGLRLASDERAVRVVDGQPSLFEIEVIRTDIEGAVIVEVDGLPQGVFSEGVVIPATRSHGRILFTTSTPITFGGPIPVHLRAVLEDGSSRADLRVLMTVAGASGSVDESYSYDGVAVHRATRDSNATHLPRACAIDDFGSITVVGSTNHGDQRNQAFALRVLRDGTRDMHWGRDGVVQGIGTDDPKLSSQSSTYYDVALQNDGSVLLLGSIRDAAQRGDTVVARRSPEGLLDLSFGDAGVVRGLDQDSSWIASNNNALFVGNESIDSYDMRGSATAFIGDKIASFPYGRGPSMLDREGRLLVASSDANQVSIVRYNSDGSRDTSFGRWGVASMRFPIAQNLLRDIVQQSDGGIVLVGERLASNDGAAGVGTLIRFSVDGMLDTSFANDGVAYADSLRSAYLNAAVDGEDRIVVVSEVEASDGTQRSVLTRYNPDGRVDRSFGENGHVESVDLDTVQEIIVDREGDRLYLCGATEGDIALVRYWN